MSAFEGFGPGVEEWFVGLLADNSREYFSSTRDYFDTNIRGQLEAMLNELSDTFGGTVKLYRQNRDVRFSADKSPYKSHTYGILFGSRISEAGCYASVSADGMTAGGGYFRMAPDQLARFRQFAAEDPGETLQTAVDDAERAGLEVWGDQLATAPRGYSKDHPRIDLLRRKSLILGDRAEIGAGISAPDAIDFVSRTWQALSPVSSWLDQYVGASADPPRSKP